MSSSNNGCYWLCYETKQAIHVAERTDNDWFKNVVSEVIFSAFCQAHFGRRMTISFEDSCDVVAYTKWTYENVQRQFETGNRSPHAVYVSIRFWGQYQGSQICFRKVLIF